MKPPHLYCACSCHGKQELHYLNTENKPLTSSLNYSPFFGSITPTAQDFPASCLRLKGAVNWGIYVFKVRRRMRLPAGRHSNLWVWCWAACWRDTWCLDVDYMVMQATSDHFQTWDSMRDGHSNAGLGSRMQGRWTFWTREAPSYLKGSQLALFLGWGIFFLIIIIFLLLDTLALLTYCLSFPIPIWQGLWLWAIV